MLIESKENKKIKYINKLRNIKYMNEEEKFIIEGEHLISEAKSSNLLLETFSISNCDYDVPNNLVSKDMMNYISTLKSPSNILGICKFKKETNELGDKIIILDNIQDPGNLGTIIRSAKAFNIDTIILSNNSVNKYNEKVIRATQGMIFKINVLSKNLKTFIPYLKENNYTVYKTDVEEGRDVTNINNTEKLAVIMGNEGTGVSSEVKELVDKNIHIKINKACESLNVSVAASIIMYELNKEC